MKIWLLLLAAIHINGFAALYQLPYCINYGDRPSDYFIRCIQNNFNAIDRAFGNTLYFEQCFNDNQESLSRTFTNCIDRNFTNAQRTLIRRGVPIYRLTCYNGLNGAIPFSYQSCINNNFNAFTLIP
ncbi:MAG: hypothetical protein HN353_11800 [Bdellovibrionales bacterium]|nr:hypothetical protein [Bdellovibrionales bacterium]MBT3526833.1 hypothetical protein [Bdellovibrionales bacterium]MBT7668289.1 hypothetical protein [Bdellovibrionales bacterium]MBT7767100.1 hypothetical protein [Bdellovibrionales bacterium]